MLAQKIKTFSTFDREMKWLVLESYLGLIFNYLLLRLIPFKRLSRSFNIQAKCNSSLTESEKNQLRFKICTAIMLTKKYTPWESLCYDRAITAKFMFNRRNINNTLILGTLKKATHYEFHAWIICNNQVVLNGASEEYIKIAEFPSTFY